jgi:surface antigen
MPPARRSTAKKIAKAEAQVRVLDEARAGANDLWRWAKANNEQGTVSLYEHDGDRWLLVKTVKV